MLLPEIAIVPVKALLLGLALLLLIPVTVLWLECILALLPSRQTQAVPKPPRLAVLMPAHNEALGIRPVLDNLLPQLQPHDRLVVVADNCTDDTAAIARAAGATVLERQDPLHRGKGYALDFGIQHLAADSPEVVVLVDADCWVEPGTIGKIASQAAATGQPVQAIYLMEQPADPKPKDTISALAFMVKNLVRPLGLHRLGMPCLLTGTGMAFPWEVLKAAPLASGNIVEDMQLGLDLAIAGTPPILCEQTRVLGLLPQQAQAATSQRTRWEHGHLQTLVKQVPRLLTAALQQGRLDLLAIALDLSVPPLSLLVMLWLAVWLLASLAGFAGAGWWAAGLLTVQGGMILVAIVSAWAAFCRREIPLLTLLSVPLYVLWKIPLYFAFLVKRQRNWVRTDRDPVALESSQLDSTQSDSTPSV